MPEQGEFMFKGTSAGNQSANPVGKARRSNFKAINPPSEGIEDWKWGSSGGKSSHSSTRG